MDDKSVQVYGNNSIPEADNSGNSGTQKANTHQYRYNDNFGGVTTMATTIEGISATNPRFFGGEAGAQFLHHSVNYLELELRDVKSKNERLLVQKQEIQDSFNTLQTTNALLKERLDNSIRNSKFRSLWVALGTAFTTTGVAGAIAADGDIKATVGSILLVVVGVAMGIASYFITDKGSDA